MSLALARKYRPRNFATVAVQSHVANTLKGAIARGRVAHGYLLCGPRGTGKTTLARVLAMALNCERRGEPELQGEPCGFCSSCDRIWSGSTSLDVVEIVGNRVPHPAVIFVILIGIVIVLSIFFLPGGLLSIRLRRRAIPAR